MLAIDCLIGKRRDSRPDLLMVFPLLVSLPLVFYSCRQPPSYYLRQTLSVLPVLTHALSGMRYSMSLGFSPYALVAQVAYNHPCILFSRYTPPASYHLDFSPVIRIP